MPRNHIDTKQPPSEGERTARRGYRRQDQFSAERIYSLLLDKSLTWVGLADRDAGVCDDLVIGLSDKVVAYQVKSSKEPKGIGITALLLGAREEIKRLGETFSILGKQFPGEDLRLIYVLDDFPSQNDQLVKGQKGTTTAKFLNDWHNNRSRSLAEWRSTLWAPLINDLVSRSGLDDTSFLEFFRAFEYVAGDRADQLFPEVDDALAKQQIEDLSRSISSLIVENDKKSRWTRRELLDDLGWPDRYRLRFEHRFPLGNFVQKNEQSEKELAAVVQASSSGYVSLVGSPGSGKSTLLQRMLRSRPGTHVLRYLAFVPGAAQGQGRGEADHFFDDLNAQFSEILNGTKRLFETNRLERQKTFEGALQRAGKEYQETGTRFLIIVDGLDHIPREETYDRSLLSALPLPQSVPQGVVFVLGTQRIELDDIPLSVRAQAGEAGRRIDIQPLTLFATRQMADQHGLAPDIDRRRMFDVAQGHPLVTRYLIELILSQPNDVNDLLSGEFDFNGDLEKVYEAAWRETSFAANTPEVQRVLLLISHAQNGIEPELLASATSEDACEAALNCTGHLLRTEEPGWNVFHNSFRLFLRQKLVLRLGKPDKAYQEPGIYSTLARLAAQSVNTSQQRWLLFRYTYLAEATSDALKIATREYFINQYLEGRAPKSVRGDISDAYRLIEANPDPVKLFELMLVEDEIDRRSKVFEEVDSLIDGLIETGLIDRALGELELSQPVGKELTVVDELLRLGRVALARTLFDGLDPFGGAFAHLNTHHPDETRTALEWARRAVRFIDHRLLCSSIDDYILDLQHENRGHEHNEELETVEQQLRFVVARAIVEKTEYTSFESVTDIWFVSGDQLPPLQVLHAERAVDEGRLEEAREALNSCLIGGNIADLHSSWHRFAANLALECEDKPLAQSFVELIEVRSLDHDKYHLHETIGRASEDLVSDIALHSIVNLNLPEIAVPEERLFKGAQHHLIEIGRLIGNARSGVNVSKGEVSRVSNDTMRFLAAAKYSSNDNPFTGHLMSKVAEKIGHELVELFRITNVCVEVLAEKYDELLEANNTAFRWWLAFRRVIVLGISHVNGDTGSACRRLEAGLADIHADTPQEELQEKCEFAIAFSKVGDLETAHSLLLGLRANALGSYRPAKRDGDYKLWTDVLSLANTDDPAGRRERALFAVRLVDGLQKTTGYDKAERIAQQVLFEASATDTKTAWNAANWATSCRAFSWFAIVDACLHGLIHRNATLNKTALIVWCNIALPWLHDGWRTTSETGDFLNFLFSNAPLEELEALNAIAINAISLNAPLYVKSTLLRIIEDAAGSRFRNTTLEDARVRWSSETTFEAKQNPDDRTYGHLVELDQVSKEIENERKHHEAKSERWFEENISYGLRSATARIIRQTNWGPIERFLVNHARVTKDWEIALAVAEVAAQSGYVEAAKKLLATFAEDNESGWSWPSSRGRYRLHQMNHVLKEPNAKEAALQDFIQEIAVSRFGVSTALWSIDEIFPILFDDIPWASMWSYLESNLESSRDYQSGDELPLSISVEGDEELVSRLLQLAFEIGATATTLQASNAGLELLSAGDVRTFNCLVKDLLAGGGEQKIRALDLLVRARYQKEAQDAFSPKLIELSDDPDAGVAAAAYFLSSQWRVPLKFSNSELPAYYSLELAIDEELRESPLRNEHSQALLLDDPLGWTENWIEPIESIERFSGVPSVSIRFRAAQFITKWGGIVSFGHPASERRENQLDCLSLNLMYRRPHSEVVIRALRHVAGELWRAGRLGFQDLRLVLHELYSDPDRILLPNVDERLPNTKWPDFPCYLWGDKGKEWLSKVDVDLVHRLDTSSQVLAEYREWAVRDHRDIAVAEQWLCDRTNLPKKSSMKEAMACLKRVIRIGSLNYSKEPTTQEPDPVALYMPHQLDFEPSHLLTLNPLVAESLGWICLDENPLTFFDKKGGWMAKTVWWRDGFSQPLGQDGRRAKGQIVLLSQKGRAEYEDKYGKIKLVACAWRRTEKLAKQKESEWDYSST